jgi:glycerate kinase
MPCCSGTTALIEIRRFCRAEGTAGDSSSFGIGELILRALDEGLREIIFGLRTA